MSDLAAAIAEKHALRAQQLIVAEHRAEAAIELMRPQARVGHAKRHAESNAGADPLLAACMRTAFLEEVATFERWTAIAQEWDVVEVALIRTEQTGRVS